MQHLERSEIDAYVLPEEWTEDECLLAELQENCARKDLTGAERKAFASEVGRISAKLGQLGNSANGRVGWLAQLAEKTGTPLRTLANWWQEFCADMGYEITPRQAVAAQRDRFFNWLEGHQHKEEEERQRKAEEAERVERETYLHDLHAEVEEAILLYGWNVVYSAVLSPVLEAHDGDQRHA